MDKNVEMLNYIYQNAEMGKDTISQLINITQDENYKKMLQSQHSEYVKIFDLANKKLKELHKEGKNINIITKVSSYIMINLNTLTNKTPSHISEMLIQGSTMGIIDVTKRLKDYHNADKEIRDLADKLLTFEQRNVEECKKFL